MTQQIRKLACIQCGGPATAGPHPMYPDQGQCIRCASVTTVEIPRTLEKLNMAPPQIRSGAAWPIAEPFSKNGALWLHQANALTELEKGRNIVISTSTASGKSLVFQLWTFHQASRDPDATSLIFYPTKALGNDQARRWKQQAQTLGLPPETIGQIDGDVATNTRNRIIEQARALVMTPDSCHAWMLCRASTQPVQKFLRNLRTIIIDEAHTYETMLGSAASYFIRRLICAARLAGNDGPIQFISATATIRNPAEHLELLTGEPFVSIDESQNGTPRFTRTIHHLAIENMEGSREEQMAQLILWILDNDPKAQVIAFHDSRKGVEEIAHFAGRPDIILPYRAGYLPEARLEIENKLRDNLIRAIISTPALELGIDMPSLTHGINMDLPATRKQFHQRLGRIGRTGPGAFIIMANRNRFRRHGETLQEYYDNSVEPSLLYHDNEYIKFQQAHCLKNEMRRFSLDTMAPPEQANWPEGFDEAIRNTHGTPPPHLTGLARAIINKQPQLAFSLRHIGDENMDIQSSQDGHKVGDITVPQGLREAYPQAVYQHEGRTYRVEEWRRHTDTRTPFVRVTPIPHTTERTKPVLRRMAVINPDPENLVGFRNTNLHLGSGVRPTDGSAAGAHREHECTAELCGTRGNASEFHINMVQSVEGLESNLDGVLYYRDLMQQDPRRTRMQFDFPTTAFHLRIDQGWAIGNTQNPWHARQQIARALQEHLAYRKSIAIRDIGTMTENIIIRQPQGYWISDRSILVYDHIYGGLDLVGDLFEELETYAKQIHAGARNDNRQSFQENSRKFLQWVRGDQLDFLPEVPGPTTSDWWRVVRPGSLVRVFSQEKNEMVRGRVTEVRWEDGVAYTVEAGGERIPAREQMLQRLGAATYDWQAWRPFTNHFVELQNS